MSGNQGTHRSTGLGFLAVRRRDQLVQRGVHRPRLGEEVETLKRHVALLPAFTAH